MTTVFLEPALVELDAQAASEEADFNRFPLVFLEAKFDREAAAER